MSWVLYRFHSLFYFRCVDWHILLDRSLIGGDDMDIVFTSGLLIGVLRTIVSDACLVLCYGAFDWLIFTQCVLIRVSSLSFEYRCTTIQARLLKYPAKYLVISLGSGL